MNNVQPITPSPVVPFQEANTTTARSTMSSPQVGATEIPVRDSVIAAGKTELPQQKTLNDTMQAPHRDMVRDWVGSQLEVRPGEVKKGLDWNVNPGYPPLNVVNGIATMFVNSVMNEGKI